MATQEDLTAEGLEVPPKSDESAKKQHVASREFEEVPQIVEHCSKSVNFTPFGTPARYFPGYIILDIDSDPFGRQIRVGFLARPNLFCLV